MPEITVGTLVDKYRADVSKRLPSYLTPEHFFQLARELDRDAKIRGVAQRNPDSVMSAIFKAADCGLCPGGPFGHCFLAPFNNSKTNIGEIVFMIGWRGFVYQWVHAGAVLKVVSNVVYVGDDYEVKQGDEEGIDHRPNLKDPNRDNVRWMMDPRNIVASYAIAWLPTGLKQYRHVPKGMIELARSRSQNPDGPAWGKNYPQMAAKTAVRRLDGLIQVCGPTPENREAWDRYARTIELDRQSFRIDPVDDEPDDLPGEPAKATKTTAEGAEQPSPTPSPQDGRKEPASAPPPAKSDEIIGEDRQDKIHELRESLGMKASAFRHYLQEHYSVGDVQELRESQADKLEVELKRQAK